MAIKEQLMPNAISYLFIFVVVIIAFFIVRNIFKETEEEKKKSMQKQEQPIQKNEEMIAPTEPRLDKIRILVVDDELSVLEAFKMILAIRADSQYVLDTAEDTKSAVEKLNNNRYDIVFTDLVRPHTYDFEFKETYPGLELLRYIKGKYPSTQVIIDTTRADENAHIRAINLGALEYLRKPFLMEEIYELVDRAMRKRRRKSEKS